MKLTEIFKFKLFERTDPVDMETVNENFESVEKIFDGLTAEDVGAVAAKGDTADNTVAFTTASERTKISSGETHATLFGKIARWLTDLKTVAFTGSYKDLSDKPSIPSAVAVKGNVETNYRTGNVNLTPDNIGALAKTAVVNNNTTTVAGFALNARQANPNVDGSMAKQISALNDGLVNLYRTQVITDGWSIVSVSGVSFIALVNGCFIRVNNTKCNLHLDILLRDNFGIYAGIVPHTQMLNMDALKGWTGLTTLSFDPLQTAAHVILGTSAINDYDEKKLLRVQKYWDPDFTGLHLTEDGRLTRRYYNGSIVFGNIPVCANAGETLPPIMHQGNVIHVDIYGASYS